MYRNVCRCALWTSQDSLTSQRKCNALISMWAYPSCCRLVFIRIHLIAFPRLLPMKVFWLCTRVSKAHCGVMLSGTGVTLVSLIMWKISCQNLPTSEKNFPRILLLEVSRVPLVLSSTRLLTSSRHVFKIKTQCLSLDSLASTIGHSPLLQQSQEKKDLLHCTRVLFPKCFGNNSLVLVTIHRLGPGGGILLVVVDYVNGLLAHMNKA